MPATSTLDSCGRKVTSTLGLGGSQRVSQMARRNDTKNQSMRQLTMSVVRQS